LASELTRSAPDFFTILPTGARGISVTISFPPFH
jgi:hypothetical protein